ncbi:DUF1934 domain-containing protein [Desulfotomaculum sp. 1211_IL3151]|uniref:DUF1934 domain-containing protein n=1 Tax=Desulfotomaculum sp. 1211_IL3151 TaxID=3084055 RepID=UPI002FD9AB56
MGRNVQIIVRSSQRGFDNNPEVIELNYEGTIHQKNNNYYIVYKETENTGMGNTTTTLKVETNAITISRSGAVNMRQVFQKDLEHRGFYQTPYGDMEMAVIARNIEASLTELGGSIKLEYELELDHSTLGMNDLEIAITQI